MASESNFTFLVDESDERDTLETPNVSAVFTNLVVLDVDPSFLLYVITNFLPAVID